MRILFLCTVILNNSSNSNNASSISSIDTSHNYFFSMKKLLMLHLPWQQLRTFLHLYQYKIMYLKLFLWFHMNYISQIACPLQPCNDSHCIICSFDLFLLTKTELLVMQLSFLATFLSFHFCRETKIYFNFFYNRIYFEVAYKFPKKFLKLRWGFHMHFHISTFQTHLLKHESLFNQVYILMLYLS